jgi:two-component system, OmpR family, response regulator
MRILVVEDDSVLADALTHNLRHAGYAVDCLADGVAAAHALITQEYDLIVLDIGLPGLDGFEVLTRLRRSETHTPVIVLTARDALPDRIRGLDLGADDYIAKPFEMPELEARIRAVIRRMQGAAGPELMVGPLVLDRIGRRILLNGAPLDLSARELAVLEVLMGRAGRVVHKDQLMQRLYEWDAEVGSNAIEVYMHRVRRKLAGAPVTIRTIRGLGYMLESSDAA